MILLHQCDGFKMVQFLSNLMILMNVHNTLEELIQDIKEPYDNKIKEMGREQMM